MEETKKKKKKSWILVTIMIVILLIAATLGGYLAGASRIANDVVEQRNNQEVVEEKTSLYYDANKIENKGEGKKYSNISIAGAMNGVSYAIKEDNKKQVRATISWAIVGVNSFGTSVKINRNETDIDEIDLTFPEEVVEMYAAGFGQDITGACIVFVLKDGSAKYVNEYEAVKNQDYKDIKDLKIKDIVKFYGTGVTNEHFGYYTTVAQTKDGKLYDLNEYIN